MRKLVFALGLTAMICLYSCQKDSSEPIPVVPTDSTGTTIGFLPASISWSSIQYPEDNVTASLKYSQSDHTIKVYADDTTTTTPYDHLLLCYYYTNDGHLLKKETYDEQGAIAENFVVERDANKTIKRVLFERDIDLKKDTFNFSFSDSAGNPAYKIMTVQNNNRDFTDEINVTKKLTFLNTNVLKEECNAFFSQTGEPVLYPNYRYSYDASGKRISSFYTIDGTITHEDFYTYETTGSGLDSLFSVLGGVDGHYITNYAAWLLDADVQYLFFPLYLILWYDSDTNNNQAEFGIETHRFGALKQVRAVDNGTYGSSEGIFTFQNNFDSNKRITESTVSYKGSVVGFWRIKY